MPEPTTPRTIPRLRVNRSDNIVKLGAGSCWTIGRSPDCEIYLDDFTVSKQHAKIFLDQGFFYIEDLESRSGTVVFGNRINKFSSAPQPQWVPTLC